MAGDTVTVTLDVVAGSEPIQGVARDAGGGEHPFAGWLGLARALELALAEGAVVQPAAVPRLLDETA